MTRNMKFVYILSLWQEGLLSICFSSLLFILYISHAETVTRECLSPSDSLSKSCNILSWANLKPGARHTIHITHMGGRQAPRHLKKHCYLPVCTVPKAGMKLRSWHQEQFRTGSLKWDVGKLKSIIMMRPCASSR